MVLNQYNVIIMPSAQLRSQLKAPNNKLFNISINDDFAVFILFVKYQNNIAVMHRMRQWQVMEPEICQQVLMEHLGLFQITCEEDQGYR